MPDVVLSNDDLTVLSGPETIELLVDIGPTGTRGSKVFAGVGNPNSVAISTKILNDLYINSAPGSDYGYLYQYVSEPGGDTWVEVLKIAPAIYSKIHTVTFGAGSDADYGSGMIIIPITNITSVTGLGANNFTVQHSIINSKPLASSISSIAVSGSNLVISLEAAKYDGVWTPLATESSVHLFVSVVI
jgi:hypothetical protein